MLRSGEEYRESIRDGREVHINGERVEDVPSHPAFKPIVDARARMYDMAHEARYRDILSYEADGGNERCCTGYKPPKLVDVPIPALLDALKVPEGWTRHQAKSVLKERGEDVLPRLRQSFA